MGQDYAEKGAVSRQIITWHVLRRPDGRDAGSLAAAMLDGALTRDKGGLTAAMLDGALTRGLGGLAAAVLAA